MASMGTGGDDLIHLSAAPFVAACGADEPNQRTTTVAGRVTCPCCRGNHDLVRTRRGGPPDDGGSCEMVVYCRVCGAEPTEE